MMTQAAKMMVPALMMKPFALSHICLLYTSSRWLDGDPPVRLLDVGKRVSLPLIMCCLLYTSPIELTVRGYELSIRKSEAEVIEVE